MTVTRSEEVGVGTRRWSKEEYCRLGELGFFSGEKVELLDGEIWTHSADAAPQPKTWSKRDYYRLADLGFFRAQKVELLGGVLMVQSPQNPAHADKLDRVGDVLRATFGGGWRVRGQLPLDLGQAAEPEPDYAVVVDQSYAGGHPTNAALVVEIADSSRLNDRSTKASLYASGGVADYWIVNLIDNQVEVYRDRVADASQPFGYRYDSVLVLHPGDVIVPLALPHASVAVTDLLP